MLRYLSFKEPLIFFRHQLFLVLGGRAAVHLLALGDEGFHVGKAVFKRRRGYRRVVRQHFGHGVFKAKIRQIFRKADLRHALEILGEVGRRQADHSRDFIERNLAAEIIVDVSNGGLGVGKIALGRRADARIASEPLTLGEQDVIELVDVGDLNKGSVIVVVPYLGDFLQDADHLGFRFGIIVQVKNRLSTDLQNMRMYSKEKLTQSKRQAVPSAGRTK